MKNLKLFAKCFSYYSGISFLQTFKYNFAFHNTFPLCVKNSNIFSNHSPYFIISSLQTSKYKYACGHYLPFCVIMFKVFLLKPFLIFWYKFPTFQNKKDYCNIKATSFADTNQLDFIPHNAYFSFLPLQKQSSPY